MIDWQINDRSKHSGSFHNFNDSIAKSVYCFLVLVNSTVENVKELCMWVCFFVLFSRKIRYEKNHRKRPSDISNQNILNCDSHNTKKIKFSHKTFKKLV